MTRVAVVGGGIVGLAVAEELARRGAEVELLERNAEAGREASWAAAGILTPQGEARGPGPFLDLLQASYRMVPEAVSRIREETGFDVGLEKTGMFSAAFTLEDELELRAEARWQSTAGISVERVTAERLRREEPAVDGPAREAFWYPETLRVDVRRFVQGYAALARARGARVRTGVAAERFLVEGGRVAGVETSAGAVFADCVVDCAGSWAGFDAALPFAVPVVPARGQILQMATAGPLVRRVVHSPRGYLVQRSATELIAGTTVEYAGFDSRVTEEGERGIREAARQISSRTWELPVAARWAGLRPDTPDHMPVLGKTPVEGLFLAAGHFRNGVILAPLTGRVVADLALKGGSPFDLSAFSVTRFVKTGGQKCCA